MQFHMPVGYKVIDGKITICEEQRKIVEGIFRDYDSGVSTLRIAAALKAGGARNASGRVLWDGSTIGRILENHNYLGTEYYPQLIDTELFERVQQRRERTRAEKGRGCYRPGRDERVLFGGIITCGECGETCSHIHHADKRRNKTRIRMEGWRCKNYIYQNHVSCKGGVITDEQVKEVCVSAINLLINDRTLMCPPVPVQPEDTVSVEYRKIGYRLEKAKAEQKRSATEQHTADVIKLIYERAQERYRTLEINDADFRTKEMQEILAGHEELTGFDEELYKKLVTRIVICGNDTAEVIFLNGSSIKISYK